MAKKDPAIRELEKFIKSIGSAKEMRAIGNFAVKIIKDRTRNKGKGVSRPGGNRKTLKQVTKEYAKRRRSIKGRHSKSAKGRKSNLTLTGEMLDKMQVVKASKNELFIGWKDRKNNQKALGQEAQGRPFLFIGRAEFNLIQKYQEKRIESKARNI